MEFEGFKRRLEPTWDQKTQKKGRRETGQNLEVMRTLQQSEVVSLNSQQIKHLARIDTFTLSLMVRRTLFF